MFLNKRYNLLALFLIGFFIYIVSFLFDLQVLSRDTALSAIANQTTDTFYLTAPRGDIFDDQNERLATSSMEPHLFLNLRKIDDNKISSNIDIEERNVTFTDIYIVKTNDLP